MKCITTDEHKHGAWCSLTPDYDADQKWGYCQPGPPTTGGTGRDGKGGKKWGYCQPGPPTNGGTGRDGKGGEATS